MSTVLSPEAAHELASVLSFRDSAGNPHLDVTCPDIQGSWTSELGLAYGFPCSCCDDFLAMVEGRALGRWAKLVPDSPPMPLPQGTGSGTASSYQVKPGASWKKVQDQWAILVNAPKQPAEGSEVTVTKRDGSTQQVILGVCLEGGPAKGWTFWPASKAPQAAAVQTAEVHFRKMTGPMGQGQEEWVIVGPIGSLVEGQPVQVTKADGSTTEVIPTKVWVDSPQARIPSYATFTRPAGSSKAAPAPKVPEGYYATQSATGHNDLDFWLVQTPTEGKWAGYTFVKRVIGGHVDSPVRGATAKAALQAILDAGPEAAALLFAQKLDHCSKCNRHLTDQESRKVGMGPDCRAKA